MGIGLVGIEGFQQVFDLVCIELSVMAREREDFMAACFYCTGFVGVDMARSCTYYTFIVMKECAYRQLVRLRSADEEKYLRILTSYFFSYFIFCADAILVKAITCLAYRIRFHQCFKNFLVATCCIIAFKGQHFLFSVFFLSFSFYTIVIFLSTG